MDITQVKTRIERALADGRLSRQESQDIKAAILADKQVTEEEHKLWRELQNLIFTGEVKLED
ncbi:conserved hypothetical protein [Rippkaea orientalis PCC 8801]|uniref:Uncharacterized protein n=1 Tax=Rippkaea orientalis (strain PCC 8801 / RF-1) TaxID=41431 RepID=B7K0T7_RIPO1|nr:hypothetical protein [Rippkaea orientalis]ACK65078.1 conserved hypothetical protein [Rippkaea orientalis PCC 8801]